MEVNESPYHAKPGRLLAGQGGFTLTELLVAMVLVGVIMAALYSAYLNQQRAYETNQNVTAVQQNLRSAMYFLEKDLRMAGYDPKGAGGFGFTDIDSETQDNVRFTWDEDEDGALSGSGEYIAYRLNAADNALERDRGDGSFMDVASFISDVAFTFYATDGTPTTDPLSIRSVGVTMQAERGGHIRELETVILCRNIGLGG
ncbi:MAG: PilW family protein [Desulfobacteraceae bacterium]